MNQAKYMDKFAEVPPLNVRNQPFIPLCSALACKSARNFYQDAACVLAERTDAKRDFMRLVQFFRRADFCEYWKIKYAESHI